MWNLIFIYFEFSSSSSNIFLLLKPTTFYIVHYFLETNLPSLNNVAVNIMCIKESGVYVVKKVWNDGESLLHVIKTTVLVVQNKSERRTTHFSTHMCLFLTIFWIKRLRFGCFTYRQYSRYYHHLDTRLHVYTMHRIFPSFFGISPLLTFMYVSKFVWSSIASSIDYAADGRLFLDENEPWMFFGIFLFFWVFIFIIHMKGLIG